MNIEKMDSVIHLQPFIPHYREEFLSLLGKRLKVKGIEGQPIVQKIYTYEKTKDMKSASFKVSDVVCKNLPCKLIKGKLLFYNPFSLLGKDIRVLVLMLHFAHVGTWLLLFTKWFHHRKIILWGQGISVRRYLKEEHKPDWKLKCMISLADGIWFYMDKEKEQWQKLFPKKPMVALHNTLTGVDDMMRYRAELSIEELKKKYGVRQEVILIFCARFIADRRVDLLLEAIKRLNSQKYGFVIIGAGASKPDFSIYDNVYDFGAVYDTAVKRELFALADVYFQPGWVGLSIVEAMAYGKPIFTFKRSEETLQCVEYSYIYHGENGLIFHDIDDCIRNVEALPAEEIKRMGDNAREYVAKHLRIEQMVENAMNVIDKVCKTK